MTRHPHRCVVASPRPVVIRPHGGSGRLVCDLRIESRQDRGLDCYRAALPRVGEDRQSPIAKFVGAALTTSCESNVLLCDHVISDFRPVQKLGRCASHFERNAQYPHRIGVELLTCKNCRIGMTGAPLLTGGSAIGSLSHRRPSAAVSNRSNPESQFPESASAPSCCCDWRVIFKHCTLAGQAGRSACARAAHKTFLAVHNW